MKRWLLLIFFNITLTVTFCWVSRYNNDLQKQVKSLSQKQKQLKKLLEENAKLKYPWEEKDLKISEFLTKDLKINVLNAEVFQQEVRKFQRPNVLFSEGYISGYVWCDDCYQALKILVEQDLPLWIKNLSIGRDIYENYNLQFSMTYIVGKLETH